MSIAPRLDRQVREALLREWDPIGVQQFPGAQDEYDAYVPQVRDLLARKAPIEEIFAYLWWVETEHMLLRGDRARTMNIAQLLKKIAQPTVGVQRDLPTASHETINQDDYER